MRRFQLIWLLVLPNFIKEAELYAYLMDLVGSVTIGGSVSPAGGNFEEPVTSGNGFAVVNTFLGLSRAEVTL